MLLRVSPSTIIGRSFQRNLFKHCRNAADVVEMVVTDVEIVDLLDPKLIEVRDRLGAITFLHVFAHVKNYTLSAGRNQNSSISLTNIHVMNLEFAVGLRASNSRENE